MGDEIVDELKTNIPPAHIAIPFPVSVNRSLIILDGLAFVTLAGRQPGELKIDQAAALLAFQQCIEVNGGFLSAAGGCQRLGKFNRGASLTGGISQRGAEGVNGRLRLAIPHSLVAALQPSVGQLNLMGSVRLVEIIGQHGQ